MDKFKGIDISEMNGFIDFEKVSKEVDFVMIRAGYGRYKEDKNFKYNVEECIKYNIPFGIYYYSYALSEEQGKEESKNLLNIIRPYLDKISYPIAIDMEDSDGYKKKNGFPPDDELVKICSNFINDIKALSLIPSVYASASWFKDILKGLPDCIKWIAWWKVKEEKINKDKYKIWQYTSEGEVQGIKGNVDLSYSYVDFKKLTEYLRNVEKIGFIKLKTGLEDLTIQYMSCYKWGQDLINKIYIRLKKPAIQKSSEDINVIIKREYELEDKTMNFLSWYVYAEPLFLKLYRAICEEEE